MAMVNRIISHYQILEELGKGAMGVVYLAEDTSLARRVAIKFADQARDDQEFRARFQREARLAASLNHRNIATVYDFGETEDGRPFLVMELVNGKKLSERLRDGKSVVLACRTGRARNAFAVGCVLRDAGVGPAETLAFLAATRAGAIHSPAIEALIRDWR